MLSKLYKLGYKIVAGLSFSEDLVKDKAFQSQFKLLGESPKVIMDVGARIGTVTLKYRSMAPEANIYAFEPFPKSIEELKDKCKSDPRIAVVEAAVAEKSGSRELHVNAYDFTNSLLPSNQSNTFIDRLTKEKETIEVNSVSLDEFVQEKGIEQVDILKLDIQGGEMGALNGAEKLLSEKRIKLIYTEVNFMELYKGQPLFHDLAGHLQNRGYVLYNLVNPWHVDGRLSWADAIFVSSDLVDKS